MPNVEIWNLRVAQLSGDDRYGIMEVFRNSLNYFWDAKTSQIYRELQGLEGKEWVSKKVVPQDGKPDKNVYSITAAGREELLQWLVNGDLGLRSKPPLFLKTNHILTMLWGILYLFTSVFTWFLMRTAISSFAGLINSVLPVFMGIFTVWFQKWYPAKVAGGNVKSS